MLIPIAVAVGVLAALAYDRSRAGPMLLTVLSPFPLVLLVVFLMLSPVSKLVLPGAEVETSEAAIPRDAPVVMIVFDELSGLALMGPDGEINESRYPSFARLADDATWYRNATTVADFTGRAISRCSAARSPIKAPPDRVRLPAKPLHAAGWQVLVRRPRARDRHLPRAAVPGRVIRPRGRRHPAGGSSPLISAWSRCTFSYPTT